MRTFCVITLLLATLNLALGQVSSDRPNIWSLSPAQRQVLLARQQVQGSPTSTVNFQQQIHDAFASQQQAQLKLLQTQRDSVQSQQNAFQARQDLTAAAMEAGRASVQAGLVTERMYKQTNLVQEAANTWAPPKTYSASSPPPATLTDPFAQKVSQVAETPMQALKRSISGSCLAFDEEHGVAETTTTCMWSGVSARIPTNLYPVLPDGSLLDSPDRVKRFLQNATESSGKICLMRPEGELIWVR